MNSAIRHSLQHQRYSDTPVPHALYLRATQQNYATTDIWADTRLNKSAHASLSRGSTHSLFAKEVARVANSSGVLRTCVESPLTLSRRRHWQPTTNTSRHDGSDGIVVGMWTRCCRVNAQRNFSAHTRLIMDVIIGHVFDTHHKFKPNTLRSLSNSKCIKYAKHYQRQCLAFAPIVANSLGQFGALNTQNIINDSAWPLLQS